MTFPDPAQSLDQAFPAEFLKSVYGIEALVTQRIADGDEGAVWKVQSASGGCWSVKRFRRLALPAVQQRAVLIDRLAADGFPFPRIHRTIGGEMATTLDGFGALVCEWLLGSTVDALSSRTGESAGSMLGKLHLTLKRGADVVQYASRKNWEATPAEWAISTCRTFQQRIEALASPAELDGQIYDALDQRIAILSNPRLESIRDGLPSLARQPIHGDYTRPNLLFTDERLVGILDLLGSTGYPVWELGRIAFEPSTVVSRPDWVEVAASIVRSYRAEVPLTRAEAAAVVPVTMLYFLFSFWGVEGRYPVTGGTAPRGYEDYWLNRQRAAGVMFENLAGFAALIEAAKT